MDPDSTLLNSHIYHLVISGFPLDYWSNGLRNNSSENAGREVNTAANSS